MNKSRLSTNFLGLELKNPLIVAAGPWARNGKSILSAFKAGAGAVVTESIVSDVLQDVRPIIAWDEKGAQNIRLYSDIQVEDWEEELKIAKSEGGIVIASISASTDAELSYLATKMEKYGADAIEISVSNPMWESLEVIASNAEIMYEITKTVVSSVNIPVIVKLSQNTTNIAKVAKAVKAAGGSAVTAINTVRGILGVDIESEEPSLSTYGGVSGEYIRPLGLASVATIAQTVDIPICGVGGISNFKNAIEYMMLGSSTVQVGTAVMKNGYSIITKIVEDMEAWANSRDIESIDDIKSKALNNLKSFDEMKIEPVVSTDQGTNCEQECNKCISACIYDAIVKIDDSVEVKQNLCIGCGLCTFMCPVDKLKLEW